MEGSLNDLAKVRFIRAKEMIESANNNLISGDIKTSLNRSYYAIFHGMRAVNIIDGFDSSKHSGVIAHFNQYSIKTGKIDEKYSRIIKNAVYFREKSDYDDFYIASIDDAKKQLEDAKDFLNVVESIITSVNEEK